MSDEKQTPYVTPMDRYGGSILLMTSPEQKLHNLELFLRSMIKKGKEYISAGDPLLNDLGISSVLSHAQSIIDRDTIIGNLTDKEITQILIKNLAYHLIKDLMLNRVKYEIKDSEDRSKIVGNTLRSAFICMKRGYNQGERHFWAKIQHESRNVIENSTSKQGILSKLGMK